MATETLDPEPTTLTEEELPSSTASDDDDVRPARTMPSALVVVGFGITAVFLLFLTLGSVTAYEEPAPGGVRGNREMRVLRIWSLLHDNLPQVEHLGLLRIALDVALAVLIVSIVGCVWLALAAGKAPRPEAPTGDSPESSQSGA